MNLHILLMTPSGGQFDDLFKQLMKAHNKHLSIEKNRNEMEKQNQWFHEVVFFFNWDSPHARLNSHYEAWNYKKKSTKKITGYRKSV